MVKFLEECPARSGLGPHQLLCPISGRGCTPTPPPPPCPWVPLSSSVLSLTLSLPLGKARPCRASPSLESHLFPSIVKVLEGPHLFLMVFSFLWLRSLQRFSSLSGEKPSTKESRPAWNGLSLLGTQLVAPDLLALLLLPSAPGMGWGLCNSWLCSGSTWG